VPKETGYPDIVIEATGVSRVVFDAMEILGPNGVLCLLSVTGGDTMNAEPIDLINQRSCSATRSCSAASTPTRGTSSRA
jgi:threonine dehydrogenase-like Zn-dependent dehydrogenase